MTSNTVDLRDVQGVILRGYNMDVTRFFILQINDGAKARQFTGLLVSGEGSVPQITTSEHWGPVKPDHCLNIGFTFKGLEALQVDPSYLGSFPQTFQDGAAAAAATVGDTGDSAPANWVGGLSDVNSVHVVLALYAQNAAILDQVSETLRGLFAQYAITELSAQDANNLPNPDEMYSQYGKIHFGYTDGISQPRIAGTPSEHSIPDHQPLSPTGEFLMGYPSQNPNQTYRVSPPELSLNSSFAAFRILKQDVAAFESFLGTAGQYGLDPEKLAAKVSGRWRNGVPLMFSPDTPWPDPPTPADQLNNYDYVPDTSAGASAPAAGSGEAVKDPPPYPDDTCGFVCPIGSHMRRGNPRGEAVVGGGQHLHRILRRGVPYGPPYDPKNPDDIERGLVGFFINADLANQFEFLMTNWINSPTPFVMANKCPNGGNTFFNVSGNDVFLGDNDPATSSFTLANPDGKNTVVKGFDRFIITRGGAYCYLPSRTAMKYLANPQG
ncbi:MAG TPA: peroxidase [Blastocatellia bacterium]|nr:peroxidase [Blastocatellia bacterium]